MSCKNAHREQTLWTGTIHYYSNYYYHFSCLISSFHGIIKGTGTRLVAIALDEGFATMRVEPVIAFQDSMELTASSEPLSFKKRIQSFFFCSVAVGYVKSVLYCATSTRLSFAPYLIG